MRKRKRKTKYFRAIIPVISLTAIFGISADAAPCREVLSAQETAARSLLGISSATTNSGNMTAVTDLTESGNPLPIILISAALVVCAVAVIIAVLRQDGAVPKNKRTRK